MGRSTRPPPPPPPLNIPENGHGPICCRDLEIQRRGVKQKEKKGYGMSGRWGGVDGDGMGCRSFFCDTVFYLYVHAIE